MSTLPRQRTPQLLDLTPRAIGRMDDKRPVRLSRLALGVVAILALHLMWGGLCVLGHHLGQWWWAQVEAVEARMDREAAAAAIQDEKGDPL